MEDYRERFGQRARSLRRMMYLLLRRSTDSLQHSRRVPVRNDLVGPMFRGVWARREIEFSISSGKGPASRFRRVSCPWVVGRLVRWISSSLATNFSATPQRLPRSLRILVAGVFGRCDPQSRRVPIESNLPIEFARVRGGKFRTFATLAFHSARQLLLFARMIVTSDVTRVCFSHCRRENFATLPILPICSELGEKYLYSEEASKRERENTYFHRLNSN